MSDKVNIVRQASGFRSALLLTKSWLIRQRRKFIPYLVWYGDEIDVRIVFTADRLSHIEAARLEDACNEALMEFRGSPVRDAEQALARLGVQFDTGMGLGGRDWEWDFSLCGPVRVQFKRRAQRPERRAALAKATPSSPDGKEE